MFGSHDPPRWCYNDFPVFRTSTRRMVRIMAITYEEALASVLPCVPTQDVREVPLPDVAGEILAREVIADRNIPPFPRAAMDGFAVVWTGKETERTYGVVGSVNPGTVWSGDATEAGCVRIMTGAMVPAPFDTVIQVEHAQVDRGGSVRFQTPASRGQNIAREGEDVLRGAVLIPSGTYLSAHHVATLSSVGGGAGRTVGGGRRPHDPQQQRPFSPRRAQQSRLPEGPVPGDRKGRQGNHHGEDARGTRRRLSPPLGRRIRGGRGHRAR